MAVVVIEEDCPIVWGNLPQLVRASRHCRTTEETGFEEKKGIGTPSTYLVLGCELQLAYRNFWKLGSHEVTAQRTEYLAY